MALDFFAIATQGAFPTPTPTGAGRMANVASWGYLGTAGVFVDTTKVGLIRVVLNAVEFTRTVLIKVFRP